MNIKKIILCIFLLISSITLAGCTSTPQNEANTNTILNSAQQTDTEIIISISDLSTTAKFYSYEFEGITIRYFAVKTTSGSVHVALDACDVCYEAKKGYRQTDTNMQCINCGNQYPISSIGTENLIGGCWPSYIPIIINEENIVIQINDIESKAYMF